MNLALGPVPSGCGNRPGLQCWSPSCRFFVIDKTFGTVAFHVPAVEIALIVGSAYLATLLTTYLPAPSASRVAPAEALR
jgi:ABC-type lipoprotein release transport system permease subunit